MNIIILTKNYERYVSGYYHHDINKEFMKKGQCYLYGEGYPKYDRNDNIQDVINKSPFNEGNIDIIIVGTSWEEQNAVIEESDPHPNINLRDVKVPKIFFLNKEYKKLDKKLDYAKRNNFDLVCTAHHDWGKWAKQTHLRFFYLPFSANPERFKDYGSPRKYDFGFSGSLHRTVTDMRYRIKLLLFKNPECKSNQSFIFNRNPLVEEFANYRIYWAEWGARNLFGQSLLPTGVKYAKFLSSFKIFLATPSAAGLIGTRYFECMATKTLILCPENEHYHEIFKHNFNCMMFKEDLSDFIEKLHYLLSDDRERVKIIENAYQDFINNHTYSKRIEMVLNTLDI